MTSTEMKLGLTGSTRPSSRVLKPPGGGHTNIFGEPEVAVNAPRPKYNQQNSSNLNACMGSTDPNQVVEKLREEIISKQDSPPAPQTSETKPISLNNKTEHTNGGSASASGNDAAAQRGRVPPGGFSSGGFW